jgi:rod shape determining protein RodA
MRPLRNLQVWSWKGQRPLSGWRSMIAPRVPWPNLDFSALLLSAILVAASLVFVVHMQAADEAFGRDGVSFGTHVKKVLVALPFLFVGFLLRPRWLRRQAGLLYGLALFLLALVPVVGVERNNAKSWIALPFGFDLQPAELAKIGLILALARVLYRNRLERARDWLYPGATALLPIALVAAQPDLGTALTIVPVTLGMLWVAGGSGRLLLGLVAAGLLLGFCAWRGEWVHGYQKKRIDVWADCFAAETLIENRNGAAFHPYMSRTSIGAGGWFGAGLGRGVANESGHLPERESDSIFSVVANELGFVGTSFFVAVYLLFSALLLMAASRTRERFSRLVVVGAGLYFAAHFFIHAGVNLGLLPMTGLTLPLISTGGSSMLASFLALGLALGLSARHEPALDFDAFRS